MKFVKGIFSQVFLCSQGVESASGEVVCIRGLHPGEVCIKGGGVCLHPVEEGLPACSGV